jgi:hypothetical protein
VFLLMLWNLCDQKYKYSYLVSNICYVIYISFLPEAVVPVVCTASMWVGGVFPIFSFYSCDLI